MEWLGIPLARNPVFLTMHRMQTVSGNRRTTVKAIRAHSFGGPEVLQLETVEDPVPGPGEVVVEVRAAGVNPADTYMRTGTYAIRPELPYIPGGDAGGVISAIGPGVSEHKVGDRVFVGGALSFDLTGCYAEKVKRKASEVLSLPEGVSFAQAATFGVSYSTAHYALFERGGAQAGSGDPCAPEPVSEVAEPAPTASPNPPVPSSSSTRSTNSRGGANRSSTCRIRFPSGSSSPDLPRSWSAKAAGRPSRDAR